MSTEPFYLFSTCISFARAWEIICSNFSLNSPRELAEQRELRNEKKSEKINDPEDSVKNASLPYIIAIKKKSVEEKEKQQND